MSPLHTVAFLPPLCLRSLPPPCPTCPLMWPAKLEMQHSLASVASWAGSGPVPAVWLGLTAPCDSALICQLETAVHMSARAAFQGAQPQSVFVERNLWGLTPIGRDPGLPGAHCRVSGCVSTSLLSVNARLHLLRIRSSPGNSQLVPVRRLGLLRYDLREQLC